MRSSKPVLVLNPTTDRLFAAYAELLLDSGVSTPEQLQASLRRDYPSAIVNARVLSDELIAIWYVYRDGRWVNAASTTAAHTPDAEFAGYHRAGELARERSDAQRGASSRASAD
jgi:hypothetical protein